MALGFYFDMTSCIGCKACQMSCKDKNDLDLGTLYRNVKGYEVGSFPMPGLFYLSNTCNHCENPACVAICPTGAMYKTEDGVVLHDDDMCIGCQACANACPYMVPKYNAEKNIVNKCDSCAGIRANGGQPQCVASCVMRALEFGDMDELKAKHPDAVSIAELPIMPADAAATGPNTIVSAKSIVSADAVEKFF